MPEALLTETDASSTRALSRVGFAGLGWIGRNRLEALTKSGLIDVAAIFDPALNFSDDPLAKQARILSRFEQLLSEDIDAVVIATPSALHAEQAIAALEAGKSVFCQKPLGRNGQEVREVVDAARRANRLLGVDLSYRFTRAMQCIHNLITTGQLGKIYAIEAKFHNAYGPDKPWFYNPQLSGGGCLIDLGIHLVDLALWSLGWPEVDRVHGLLMSKGREWQAGEVEDYITAQVLVAQGPAIQLSCSWRAPAGCDAEIELTYFGTQGGARFRNIDGSFYHFVAEHLLPNRTRQRLTEPDDDWSGGAIVDWAKQLSANPHFDPACEHLITSAEVLDRIYGRTS